MELRHLRYFVAVGEELHFGRAAERMRVAQPALSQQVRSLERELGAVLLDRSRRHVRLTHAGRLFLEEASATLRQAERAARTARRAHRGEVGRLSLGFVGSATYEVLPTLLRAFRRDCPGVELELETLSTLQQERAFEEGWLQVGILRPPTEYSLATRPVLREPLVAVLPVEHPAAQDDRVSLSSLSGENFILWPRNSGPRIHDQIVSLCRAAGFEPKIVQESTELQTIAGLVAAGLGVSLIIANPEHLRSRRVVYRAVEDASAGWELALAWKPDDPSPVVRAFVASVERTLGLRATEGTDPKARP